MINIIHILIQDADVRCYFCGKYFTSNDFPLQGKDKIEIHHISYVPEVRILAHKKCHRKFHADQKKTKA